MNDLMKSRTIGLLGEESFKKIENSTIAIFGLGGVGGTALEALVRTGVSNILLVDFDIVSFSNLNRQIQYLSKDIGKMKVDVAKDRVLSINPDCTLITLPIRIGEDSIKILDEHHIDFIIDAIDDVKGKVALMKYALMNNIHIISSLGMANRFDPGQVYVTSLNKTTMDPLAKKMRYEIKKEGLEANKISVVCSKETPRKNGNQLNSTMMVPSSCGLNIANYVIKTLIGE